MTSALEDASATGAFTWDGTWFDSFQDFTIDRIGPDAVDFEANRYWGYALNFKPSQVGGCQQQVAGGDEVLFGYDFFSKKALLKLTGPASAATGEAFRVTVVDGQDGKPAKGATVSGSTTGDDGTATLTFDTPGTRRFKAERPDSLRSNAVAVCVYEPGSGDCGSADTIAPVVRLDLPRAGHRYRVGPRELRGRATDNVGLAATSLRLRRADGGRCSWYNGTTERFIRRRNCTAGRFFSVGDRPEFSYLLPERLPPGRYTLEARGFDRSGNLGTAEIGFSVRPRRSGR